MKTTVRLRYSLLLAGLLLFPGAPRASAAAEAAQAPAAVAKITVTFYGDAASARGFTWYTAAASTGSDLQLVEKTGGTPDFGKASAFSGRSYPSPLSPAENVHKAEAGGLKPGTEYYFRAGDAARGIWSGTGYFRTAPEKGAFTFIDLADTQAKNESEAILSGETIAKAFETLPGAGFLAVNGDLVDTGSDENQWNWLLGHAQRSLLRTTLLPAAGNHEEQKGAFIGHFNIKPAPGSDTASGAYYSTDYANAHFIVLNTNENSWSYADMSGRQVAWLKNDAAAAKARGAEWLIVVMHKGPYTTSSHATDSDIRGWRGVRTRIAPLLAELGADLVLQGHDHIYARTKPIKKDGTADAPARTAGTLNGKSIEYLIDPGGTVYLIPATAGAKTYYRNKKAGPAYYSLFELADESHAAVYGPDPKAPSRPMRARIQNFTGITVDGQKLTAVSYEIDQSSNSGRPYIIDQFGIVKSGAGAGAIK